MLYVLFKGVLDAIGPLSQNNFPKIILALIDFDFFLLLDLAERDAHRWVQVALLYELERVSLFFGNVRGIGVDVRNCDVNFRFGLYSVLETLWSIRRLLDRIGGRAVGGEGGDVLDATAVLPLSEAERRGLLHGDNRVLFSETVGAASPYGMLLPSLRKYRALSLTRSEPGLAPAVYADGGVMFSNDQAPSLYLDIMVGGEYYEGLEERRLDVFSLCPVALRDWRRRFLAAASLLLRAFHPQAEVLLQTSTEEDPELARVRSTQHIVGLVGAAGEKENWEFFPDVLREFLVSLGKLVREWREEPTAFTAKVAKAAAFKTPGGGSSTGAKRGAPPPRSAKKNKQLEKERQPFLLHLEGLEELVRDFGPSWEQLEELARYLERDFVPIREAHRRDVVAASRGLDDASSTEDRAVLAQALSAYARLELLATSAFAFLNGLFARLGLSMAHNSGTEEFGTAAGKERRLTRKLVVQERVQTESFRFYVEGANGRLLQKLSGWWRGVLLGGA